MKSIVDNSHEGECHYCGRQGCTHKHHIFGGANRKWSEKYGLFVFLCPEHHNMSNHSVHFDKDLMDSYHRLGQFRFEVEYACQNHCSEPEAKAEFMRIFGKNYL